MDHKSYPVFDGRDALGFRGPSVQCVKWRAQRVKVIWVMTHDPARFLLGHSRKQRSLIGRRKRPSRSEWPCLSLGIAGTGFPGGRCPKEQIGFPVLILNRVTYVLSVQSAEQRIAGS